MRAESPVLSNAQHALLRGTAEMDAALQPPPTIDEAEPDDVRMITTATTRPSASPHWTSYVSIPHL